MPWYVPLLPILIMIGCVMSYMTYQSTGLWMHLLMLGFGVLMLPVTLMMVLFFRDPERAIGEGVVAPADGVVTEVSEVKLPNRDIEAKGKFQFIKNQHL